MAENQVADNIYNKNETISRIKELLKEIEKTKSEIKVLKTQKNCTFVREYNVILLETVIKKYEIDLSEEDVQMLINLREKRIEEIEREMDSYIK